MCSHVWFFWTTEATDLCCEDYWVGEWDCADTWYKWIQPT